MNKKHILLSTILFLTVIGVIAQPTIEWEKSLGGTGQDNAYCIEQAVDGGYIVVGWTDSNDGDVSGNHSNFLDYWIVKLDSTGSLVWQKALGGTGNDYVWSVKQTTDGGYIVAGQTISSNGDVTTNQGSGDVWLVKLTSSGSISWDKSLGGTNYDGATSIEQTTDGGYIMAGWTESTNGNVTGNHGLRDFWVVKLTSTGSISWQKALGGTGYDVAYSIQQTSDGGYIVAGSSSSSNGDVSTNYGGEDYWVVKLTSTGSISWEKSLGGTQWETAFSIQQTSDGGYIVAGQSESNNGHVTGNHGASDYWVVKLTNSGTIDWQKTLGGSSWDRAKSIKETANGNYIVAGVSSSNNGDVTGNNGNSDYWVVQLNNAGNIDWEKSLGGTANDEGRFIVQTSDGGYIVAGGSNSPNNGDVTGNHNGSEDFWVVKLSASTVGINSITNNIDVDIYPNPNQGVVNINLKELNKVSVKVFNFTNQLIYQKENINTPVFQFNINEPPGFYLVEINCKDDTYRYKLIKE